MKKLFLISLLTILWASVGWATTYYVRGDCTTGGTGTSQTCDAADGPFKTIAAMQAAVTGDQSDNSVLFYRGGTWREQFTVGANGTAGHPFTIGAYGSGSKPKIYGSTAITSWTQEVITPAITKVQNAVYNSAAANTVTTSYAATPIEGNLLIASAKGNAAVVGAAISGWSVATSTQDTSTYFTVLFYKIAGAAESKDVVLTWTSANNLMLVIEEWNNIDATPLDKVANTDNTGSGTTRSSGTTGNTTVDNELLIAAFGVGDVITNQSYSNSFSSEYGISGASTTFLASKVVVATGAYETTMSWTTARLAGGLIATFKGNVGGSITTYYATAVTNPLSVWFVQTNGAIRWGKKVATKAALASEFDWWWDDPNDRLYVVAATDPDVRYTSVERPTRDYCVLAISKNYITISNLDCSFSQSVDADGYGGIKLKGGANPIVEYCNSHHNGVLSADPSGNGIKFEDANGAIARYNAAYENGRRGIVASPETVDVTMDNVLIEHNTVYNNYHAGIDLFRSNLDGSFDGAIVRYNYIYNDENYGQGYAGLYTHGILVAGPVAASDYRITNALIHNNIVVKMHNDQSIGITRKVDGVGIYNNIAVGAFSTTAIGIEITGSALVTNVSIKNNIVVDTPTRCLLASELANVIACDNNLWYQSAGGASVYVSAGGSSYHFDDQAAYKAATGWDTNGKWEDPKFVSTSDFYLLPGSPAINAGVNVGLTTDYEGKGIAGPPDIGAYEKRPVKAGHRLMPGVAIAP